MHFCVYKSLQSDVHFKEIRELCSGERNFNTEHYEYSDLSTRNVFKQTTPFKTAAREDHST